VDGMYGTIGTKSPRWNDIKALKRHLRTNHFVFLNYNFEFSFQSAYNRLLNAILNKEFSNYLRSK